MADREIAYSHQVRAWTVGDLRAALEGIPDGTPLEVSTLEEPSSSPSSPAAPLEADRLVVASAGWEHGGPAPVYALWCDFPSGDDYIHYEKGW